MAVICCILADSVEEVKGSTKLTYIGGELVTNFTRNLTVEDVKHLKCPSDTFYYGTDLVTNSTRHLIVKYVKFSELETKISDSKKVLVLQIYLNGLPKVSMFEKVGLMYGDAIEFVRTDATGQDTNIMERFDKHKGCIKEKEPKQSTGKVFVFDNNQLMQSTVKITTKKVLKIVNNAFLINSERRMMKQI